MRVILTSVLVAGLLVSPALPTCDPAVTQEVLLSTPDCAALIPPRPRSHLNDSFTVPATDSCLNGTSADTGDFVLGSFAPTGESYRWRTRNALGAELGSSTGVGETPVLGEPVGYHALLKGAAGDWFHLALDANGTTTRTDSVTPAGRSDYQAHLSSVPTAGSLMVFRSISNTGNHFFSLTAQRFDAAGAPISSPALVDTNSGGNKPAWLVGGVSTSGLSLVLWERRGRLTGRWLAADGTFSTDELGDVLLPSPGRLVLSPLVDGSLALQHDGLWSQRFPGASTAVAAPPPWLAGLPNTKLSIIRGGAGYAVLPFGGAAATRCEQTVELRLPSGALCGRMTFKQSDAACVTKEIDIGRDGTVIQQMATESCSGGSCSCSHHVWPALFR